MNYDFSDVKTEGWWDLGEKTVAYYMQGVSQFIFQILRLVQGTILIVYYIGTSEALMHKH